MSDFFYDLQDRAFIKKERLKAQELKKSNWWKQKLNQGICHYCEKKYPPSELTMDHLVPLARGGQSTKNNLVISCRACNQSKKLQTPAELLLDQLSIPQE